MFCKNCGNQISESSKFCPVCGSAVQAVADASATFDENASESFTAPRTPATPAPPRKNGKIIAIISIIAALVIAAIVTVVLLIFNSNTQPSNNGHDTKESEETKDYIAEVEAYLDYFADKNDDIDKFIDEGYLATRIGAIYNGEEAAEIHEILYKAMFDLEEENMSYYYYDSFEYDSWRDYLKEGTIDYLYEMLDDELGDWELNYEITDTGKLSKARTQSLESSWEDVIKFYKSIYRDCKTHLSRDDKDTIEDFIDSLEDLEVEDAYWVEVEIELDGDRDSWDKTTEYVVAKVGDEWVILDGENLYFD